MEEDRRETLGVIHHISILESNHAASLKMGGTARTYHYCAKGQTWKKVWKVCRKIATIEQKGYTERDIHKGKGESNQWTDSQELIAPEINKKLIGYKLRWFLVYWYWWIQVNKLVSWEGSGIKNERENVVIIEWGPECLGEGDQ